MHNREGGFDTWSYRALFSHTFVFVYIREFGYYICSERVETNEIAV